MAEKKKYLDKVGLEHLVNYINNQNSPEKQAPYYVWVDSSIAANTTSGSYSAAQWIGHTSENAPTIDHLFTGLTINIKVPVQGNSTSGIILNLNNLGNHPIVLNASTLVSTHYAVGSIINLIYEAEVSKTVYINGVSESIKGVWKLADYGSTTNSVGYYIRSEYGSIPVDPDAGSLYRYQIILTTKNWTLVPYNNVSNSETNYAKPLNRCPFDPFAPIYYYNSTTSVTAGSGLAATNRWTQYLAIGTYSFNIDASGTAGVTTWVTNKPIYIKALFDKTLHTATLIPDLTSENYLERSSIVQELPDSDPNTELENGKEYIYIYLGQATSSQSFAFMLNHPVYHWDSSNSTIAPFFDASGATKTSELVNDSGFLGEEEEEVISAALNDLNTRIKVFEDMNLSTGLVASASYDSSSKRINFLDSDENVVSYIDATDFIKDGMVDSVEIAVPTTGANASIQCLVVTFNTEAGKDDIEIPLSSLFDSGNYYTKTEVDTKLGTVYTKTEVDSKLDDYTTTDGLTTLLDAKLDKSTYSSDEKVISAALNDLNSRIIDLEDAAPDFSSLAAVATSGSYNDLSDTPTIPTVGTLNTNTTTALSVNSSESLSGTIRLHKVAKTGSYNDLLNKPTIPSAVTESTVSGWGFTKNTGTITGITMNGSSKGTSGVVNLGTVVTSETDPVFTASAASGITSSDITNWNSKTDNVGTITGISMNGSSVGTSGVVDLGTVITSHQDISGKENTSNKVTSLSAASTDDQYPSAKCVYDQIGDIESALDAIIGGTGNSNIVTSTTITKIVSISQSDYDALVTKDSSTLYVIV